MNRGERSRDRAVANGQNLPEQEQRIRTQQELPDGQPTPKNPETVPIRPRIRAAMQTISQRFVALEERTQVRQRQEKLPKDHSSRITRPPRYTMAHQARPVPSTLSTGAAWTPRSNTNWDCGTAPVSPWSATPWSRNNSNDWKQHSKRQG